MFPLFFCDAFRVFLVQLLKNETKKQKEHERGASGLYHPAVVVAVPAGNADMQYVGTGYCPNSPGSKQQRVLRNLVVHYIRVSI